LIKLCGLTAGQLKPELSAALAINRHGAGEVTARDNLMVQE